MKKKLITLIPVLTGILIFTIIIIISRDSKRDKYEKYLCEEISNIPDFIKCTDEGTSADHPEQAAIQNYFMTLDPELGRVPVERLKDACKQTRAIQREYQNIRENSIVWTNIPSNMGGRARTIMYDPNDSGGNKVWAGGVTGGLWYINDITDNNAVWTPVNDFWDNITISCMTYDPNNSQIFYVGTGEAQTSLTIYRESSGVGIGIWKTTDGGQSWSLLSSSEDFAYITDIKVRDENGTSVVYAAVVSGEYKGIVHQSLPTDGLYRSDNGGQSWTQVLPDITGEDVPYAPADIEIGADGRIYVSTYGNINLEGGATILYSDDGTAGSWNKYEYYHDLIENLPEYNIPGRTMLACAPSDENIIYAIISAGRSSGGFDGFSEYLAHFIIRSDNKGQTWTETNMPDLGDDNWAYIAWHAFICRVAPDDPDILWIGGLDLYRTKNAGDNWSVLSDWGLMYDGGGDQYVHADQHAIIYKPGSSDEMVFACDGGIFYTNEANENEPAFREMNNNFSTLQFYSCAIHPGTSQDILAGGLQDNGSVIYTGDTIDILDMVSGGDGAYCFFDKNEEMFITGVYNNRYYVFVDWEYVDGIYDNYSGTFTSPADYDSEMNTLYANAGMFTGNHIDDILRVEDIPSNLEGDFIDINTGTSLPFSSVQLSPNSPSNEATLFVGTLTGELYKVEDAHTNNPSVSEIGDIDFPTAAISCVAVGGSDDTLLVTFSNYGVSSVWQTYNGGNSWQEKEGNLPDMPVRWALFHPQNTNQALLATEIGVWTTNILNDDNVIWEPAINGLANVRVDMLQLRDADNKVVAATHGRGFFTATFEYDPVGINDLQNKNLISVYPNPTNGVIYLNGQSENISVMIYNSKGRTVLSKEGYISSLDLTKNAEGIYYIRICENNKKYINKIILQK